MRGESIEDGTRHEILFYTSEHIMLSVVYDYIWTNAIQFRQPTLSFHYICMEVLTVDDNEVTALGTIFKVLEIRTYHQIKNEWMV